jgi:hypothetical protein
MKRHHAALVRFDLHEMQGDISYLWDEDGSLVLKARLPAEAGALVLKALEAALAEVPFEIEEIRRRRCNLDPRLR